MRFLYTVFAAILFLATLGFAIKNTQPVTVDYFFGFHWSASLVIVLFATFATGAVVGIVANLGFYIRQKREIRSLKKQIKQMQSARPASPPQSSS